MTATHPELVRTRPAHVRQEPGARRRGGLALALALSGATLVGGGVLSGWTATTGVTSGALTAATGAATMVNANGGTFTSAVPDLLPGDFFYRYVDLKNAGATAGSFAGQVTATGDLAAVLSAQVDACSTAWAADGTCSGTTTAITAKQLLTTAASADYGSIAPGDAAVKHVRYTFTFSSDAAAALMGKTGSVAASVNSTLVGGRNRTAI
jgi:hypothetical protein